jgi:hypothetical protein
MTVERVTFGTDKSRIESKEGIMPVGKIKNVLYRSTMATRPGAVGGTGDNGCFKDGIV